MSMRRRNVTQDETDAQTGDVSTAKRLARTLKRVDVFPKVEEEFAVQTETGAAVGVTSFIIMALLFFNEYGEYSAVRHEEHVGIDNTISEKLTINFNLTFPALKCGVVMLDVMDVAGEQQVNVNQKIHKLRLNGETGAAIGHPYLDLHKVDPHAGMKIHVHRQGSGRNAVVQIHMGPDKQELEKKRQANEEKAKKALQQHGHGHDDEEMEDDPSQDGEGCTVWGELEVNKVAGNFHVALGASHKSGGKHVHHFMLAEARSFNSSHIINHLSFGPKTPGVINPLDGVPRILTKSSGHFQYFLKVVPTTYVKPDGATVSTSQYSVTEQMKAVDLMHGGGKQKIPGVFFIYDVSPFRVTVRDAKTQSFGEFLVSVCAIIGGVFTVAGFVDSYLHHSKILKRNS